MIKLSHSEFYVMRIIWKKGKATSFDILNSIKETNDISPNSVRTLLSRLLRKKAIEITEKNGKTYVYKALLNKQEFINAETDHFIETVFNGSKEDLLLTYYKEGKLTKQYLIELYHKLEE